MQLLYSVVKITSSLPWCAPAPHRLLLYNQKHMQSIFYVFPSEFPWFPWDWILSQIMPEGGLSCMDPLGSTSLCRGSEVWEKWCMWPGGCTSTVFSDDLTAPAALWFTTATYIHASTQVYQQQHMCKWKTRFCWIPVSSKWHFYIV